MFHTKNFRIMTKYNVSVDVTVDVSVEVEATNEREAEKEALIIIEKEPYYYIRKGESLLNAVVAGNGPDVVISTYQSQPVDYAMRNANVNLRRFKDCDDMLAKGYGRPVAGPMSGSMSGLQQDCIDEMKAIHHGEQVGPVPVKKMKGGDCSGMAFAGLLSRLAWLPSPITVLLWPGGSSSSKW